MAKSAAHCPHLKQRALLAVFAFTVSFKKPAQGCHKRPAQGWLKIPLRAFHRAQFARARCGLLQLPAAARNLVSVLLVSLSVACSSGTTAQSIVFTGATMGTDYRVTIVISSSQGTAELENRIAEQLQSVNLSMSTYLEDSEVSRFNRLDTGETLEISEPLRAVIQEALEISALTDGAFDITVANAVNLWGFGPDGAITARPDKQQLAALRSSIGYRYIKLENNQLSKTRPGTAMDLSAIAKGYAVDQLARMLISEGIQNFLINIGGELRASGNNSTRQAWKVAIEQPRVTGGIQQVVELRDRAIATSGDYRNYLTLDGVRYSHTINPVTLQPVLHRLALVSVIDDHASTADALATAMMVMGEERALLFAEKFDLAAYFVIRSLQGSGFEVRTTRKFDAILR